MLVFEGVGRFPWQKLKLSLSQPRPGVLCHTSQFSFHICNTGMVTRVSLDRMAGWLSHPLGVWTLVRVTYLESFSWTWMLDSKWETNSEEQTFCRWMSFDHAYASIELKNQFLRFGLLHLFPFCTMSCTCLGAWEREGQSMDSAPPSPQSPAVSGLKLLNWVSHRHRLVTTGGILLYFEDGRVRFWKGPWQPFLSGLSDVLTCPSPALLICLLGQERWATEQERDRPVGQIQMAPVLRSLLIKA